MTFLSVIYAATLRAQPADIPDSLLTNSDAVIRLSTLDFVYNSPTSGTAKYLREMTILNNTAAPKGYFICNVSASESLKSFSGTLSDARGNIIRKFKRSDLQYTEYSSGSLATDAALYYMEVHAASYPYTVRYEYEIDYKNGLIDFPAFAPILSAQTALEKGVCTLSLPAGTEFAYKGNRIGEPDKRTQQGRDLYRWTLTDVPAVADEPASPPLTDLLPLLFSVPCDFTYEKTHGSSRDWAAFGAWQCSLLEGRDRLPEALRAEVHRLTDSLPTPREKVKALYDYLGQTTRYVSIQLGIGGLQPASAAEVFQTKFGDCKALTNYLCAMLKECGIASDYVVIDTRRKRLYPDFASANQGDHVILHVPLDDGDLWLECTDPDWPFGYIHGDIAGHDAILHHDGTGTFVTLPQYADSLNRMEQRVELTLDADGAASGHISELYTVAQYDSQASFTKMDAKKQVDYLLSDLKAPLIQVSNIACTEDKSTLPSVSFDYDFSAPKYFNITGSRCFLPQTPFSRFGSYKDKERLYDIYYDTGYSDLTLIKIHLPDNIQVESLPFPRTINAPFGSYSLSVSAQAGELTIRQQTFIRAGTYPRTLFEQYKAFINGRAKAFNADIVLKKI